MALIFAGACSGGAPSSPAGAGGAAATGGSSGSTGGQPGSGGSTTGAGGLGATGGRMASGGAPGAGGSLVATGGASGGAGSAGAMGGQAGAPVGGPGGSSGGGQTGTSPGGHGAEGGSLASDFDALFEAETIPPNETFGFARRTTCARTCTKPLTPGDQCCSGGAEVTWIVSKNGAHPSGWMQFNDVAVPADGDYDVTFWYHSGGSDTYGDDNCGGQPMTEPGQFGCRPHVFTVNGKTLPGAYHFPVFTGAQTIIHVATVSLPLSKGTNTLMVAPPPPRDAVDVDAIEIQPPGKGRAPRVAANTTDLLGGK